MTTTLDWYGSATFSVDTDVAPIRAALAEQAPEAVLLELGYVDATPIF
jgi:hypothetical protein